MDHNFNRDNGDTCIAEHTFIASNLTFDPDIVHQAAERLPTIDDAELEARVDRIE